MKTLLSKWISYHKCPHCGSENTLHAYAMKNFDPNKNYANVYSINLGVSHFNENDVTLTKRDLCLECGRDWVMYIEKIDSEGVKMGLGVKLNYTDERDEEQ